MIGGRLPPCAPPWLRHCQRMNCPQPPLPLSSKHATSSHWQSGWAIHSLESRTLFAGISFVFIEIPWKSYRFDRDLVGLFKKWYPPRTEQLFWLPLLWVVWLVYKRLYLSNGVVLCGLPQFSVVSLLTTITKLSQQIAREYLNLVWVFGLEVWLIQFSKISLHKLIS